MATDVCRCLGFSLNGGAYQYLVRLDPSEKQVARRKCLQGSASAGLFVGNENQLTVIAESGLYKLIMRSDKDTARPFQDWVKGGRGGDDPPSSRTSPAVLVRFSQCAPKDTLRVLLQYPAPPSSEGQG